MSRNFVKVMIYSYFLNLKSYINTYISVTYTESTVSNIKPKGNHNLFLHLLLRKQLLVILNRKVITTKPETITDVIVLLVILNRKVITTYHYICQPSQSLLVILYRKVITTLLSLSLIFSHC